MARYCLTFSLFTPLTPFSPFFPSQQGYAFCEFVDGSITAQVIAGLSGMPIGDKTLTVDRASSGREEGTALPVVRIIER